MKCFRPSLKPCAQPIRGICALVVFFFCGALSVVAQQDFDTAQIPSRPYTHILDETRWLSVAESEKIQQDFSRRFVEQQIDLYLVILKEAPPQGAESYARVLGKAWSRAPMWCVLIQIPGESEGLHVVAGGEAIAQPRINKAVEDALKRAKRENTEKDRLLAACAECPDDLRFVLASHQRHSEKVAEAVGQIIDKRTKKSQRKKFILLGAGVGFLLFVILGYFFLKLLKNRKKEFVFPETVWRERFLGPHSGGSGVSVNFK